MEKIRSVLSSKKFILTFLALLFLAVVLPVSAKRAVKGSSDFDVYYYAGKSIAAGLPVYSNAGEAVSISKSPFLYPPFTACLFSAFSFLSISRAAVLWNFLNFLFLVGGFAIAAKIIFQSEKLKSFFKDLQTSFFSILVIALIGVVSFDNLMMAQVNPVVFFFLMLTVQCVLEKKETAAGISLGFAVVVKLVPAIFIFYFLIKKKWRTVVSCLASLVLFFGLLPALALGVQKSGEYHQAWFRETIQRQATPTKLSFYSSQLSPSHQNLQSVLYRLLIDWDFRETTGGENGRRFLFRTPVRLTQDQAVLAAVSAAGVVFLFFSYSIFCRKEGSYLDFLREISMACITMVLLAPKLRSHGFLYLVFPWMCLLQQIVIQKDKSKAGNSKAILLTSAFFYLLQAVKYFKFLGAGCFSALILLIYFGRLSESHAELKV